MNLLLGQPSISQFTLKSCQPNSYQPVNPPFHAGLPEQAVNPLTLVAQRNRLTESIENHIVNSSQQSC